MQVGCEIQDLSDSPFTLVNNEAGEQVYYFESKICQYKRPPNWGLGYDLETNKKRVRDEVTIRYALIMSGNTSDKNKVETTLNSVFTNEVKPVHLGIFCTSIVDESLDDILEKTGTPWQLMEYAGQEDYKSFALLNSNIWAHFFLFLKAGMELAPGFMDELDRKINDENFRFTYISNEDKSLLIMSKNLYYFNELPINELLKQLKEKNEGYFDYASLSRNSP